MIPIFFRENLWTQFAETQLITKLQPSFILSPSLLIYRHLYPTYKRRKKEDREREWDGDQREIPLPSSSSSGHGHEGKVAWNRWCWSAQSFGSSNRMRCGSWSMHLDILSGSTRSLPTISESDQMLMPMMMMKIFLLLPFLPFSLPPSSFSFIAIANISHL